MAQVQGGHVLEDRQHADRMTQWTDGVYRFHKDQVVQENTQSSQFKGVNVNSLQVKYQPSH